MDTLSSKLKSIIPALSLVLLANTSAANETAQEKQLAGAHNELATLYGELKGEWKACSKDGYLANFQYSIPLVTEYETAQYDPDTISAASALIHADIFEKLRLSFENIVNTHDSKFAEKPLDALLRTDFYGEYSAFPKRLDTLLPNTSSVFAGPATTKGNFSETPSEECRWGDMAPETDINKPIIEM